MSLGSQSTGKALEYRQVDVFTEKPLGGNGLAVIVSEQPLETGKMQALTCELRQFETIFLVPTSEPNAFVARVFTMEEELPFAGHPALGAAAVLHERIGGDSHEWQLMLPAGRVELRSSSRGRAYCVTMNQGCPVFGAAIAQSDELMWLEAFGLHKGHRDARLPICVVSTGLPYLVVPVTSEGLGQTRIAVDDLEARLASIGASFAYLFDLDQFEGRTWDNKGLTEDIATGSAAGPTAALVVREGLKQAGVPFVLNQGRYVGRPSRMTVEIRSKPGQAIAEVLLSGSVTMVARGRFDEHVMRISPRNGR